MSMKRTLLSGLVVLAPLALALPGTAAAAAGPVSRGEPLPLTTGWWPNGSSSDEESAVFAGIGGAGVLHHESGVDEWGNRWSEHDGSLAGIGGAAVLHGSHETWGGGHPDWPAQDTLSGPESAAVEASPVRRTAAEEAAPAVTPVKAAPLTRAKKTAVHSVPVRTIRETAPAVRGGGDDDYPVGDNAGAAYHAQAVSAGLEGATSAQVSSHAGRDHAWYSASALGAGPEGASSAGVAALAVPGAAGYRTWDVAAGATGAYSHSTHAAAWDGDDSDLD